MLDKIYIRAHHTLRPTCLMHWLQGVTSKHCCTKAAVHTCCQSYLLSCQALRLAVPYMFVLWGQGPKHATGDAVIAWGAAGAVRGLSLLVWAAKLDLAGAVDICSATAGLV